MKPFEGKFQFWDMEESHSIKSGNHEVTSLLFVYWYKNRYERWWMESCNVMLQKILFSCQRFGLFPLMHCHKYTKLKGVSKWICWLILKYWIHNFFDMKNKKQQGTEIWISHSCCFWSLRLQTSLLKTMAFSLWAILEDTSPISSYFFLSWSFILPASMLEVLGKFLFLCSW